MIAPYARGKRLVLTSSLLALLSPALAQTAFLDFNVVGQYTNNFNPWNDVSGSNGGNYAFAESLSAGVGGGGGVSIINNNDTTATYRSGSWNFATNGASITLSVLIYADGQTSANRTQLGILNSNTNGLNGNPGVVFESYRFVPQSATSWQFFEQYRTAGTTTTSAALGTVAVTNGHWYKFVVSLTNTSGATGNYNAGCGLYDYGATGLVAGTNLITFPTFASHTGQNIATNTAVWPCLRSFQNAGISAWDNFLVYTTNSLPVMTLTLSNVTVAAGNSADLSVLADGPGSISYSWYTNGTRVTGATNPTYTTPLLTAAYTNVMAVAQNGNGSATNLATITLTTNRTPIALTGFNRDVVIENTAIAVPYSAFGLEYNPGEGTCFYQRGLTNTSYGLPVSGSFASVIDGTVFQFQPYTTNNALVMSSETGISSGTLTLVTPVTYLSLAVLANSASATATSTGVLTIQFADGSSFVTNYNAADWFFNPGFALQAVDRINITTGATSGGPNGDPRFYQSTLNLSALLGATNKPIRALTFGQAPDAHATAVYAVSGLAGPATNVFILATVTNLPATSVQATSATLNGQVLSNGGYIPNVTFYYGPVDGGTNAASWSNSIALGTQNGAFSQAITGLNTGTTYYFAVQAQNYAGTSWAKPSRGFTTSGALPPQVNNAPATGVAATFATLNGQVVSTGGLPTGVILYYGTSDGGSNSAAWSASIALGQQSGVYAQTVSGLVPNTTYYYTAEATNATGPAWAAPSQSFITAGSNPVSTGVPVLTYHNDNTRQGLNGNETALTLANVNTNTFGKLFSCSVDGFVYAQPLVMTNVPILGKGTHNVVFVATEHNSLYAFDADSNQGANAAPLWQVSFINPAAGITTVPNGDVGTTDITPEVGITATPVIDPSTGTIYVEVKTKEVSGNVTNYVHRLHALDITSGAERTAGPVANSPVLIAATNYPGTGQGGSDTDGTHVLWNPLKEHCRPALTLVNGKVYIAYASHGDNGPYHGWLFAYDAHTLAQTSVYNSTPYGGLGGFWQGGGGATVDAEGYLYLETGNGSFDASGSTFSQANNNFAMAVLKFALTNGIRLVDYFAPSNAVSLSSSDQDLGASAPIVLPDSAGSGGHPHLLVGGGKTPPVYVMDRSNLGQFGCTTCPNNLVQQFNGGPTGDRDTTPAFFNNTLYMMGQNAKISAFTIANGSFNTTAVQTPDTFGNKGGATVCITANGTNDAIAWAIANAGGQSPSTPCVLRAYNATNIAQELYASDRLPARDAAGNAVKFTTPTIANGKVYVGAQYSLTVYGGAAVFVATPTIFPNGGSFATSVTISLSDATPNATIYYTIDGSAPTTNSLLYSAPFVLTNTATVQAIAVKPGAVNSAVASAGFVNTSAIGSGTGLLGSYWSNVTSVAFTNLGFNVAPSLTRTDAVVNFNWTNTSPDPSISSNNFVVRWTGSVQAQFNETYTFSTYSDAGVRLWVNGRLLINQWTNQPPTTWSASLPLVSQQRYNLTLDYFYQNQGGPVAALSWSSPSTPQQIIPQSQLYPVSNPPPAVVLTSPVNGASATATATVSVVADADAPYNQLSQVAFYANNALWGSATDLPYALTVPGVGPGTYILTAVATDASGLSSTSAPVTLTVTNGSALPYGLTSLGSNPAFFNMPGAFDGSAFGSLPPRLSLTGVFTNTPSMYAAPGLVSYLPNTPLWSDGAAKTRFMSVPNNGAPFSPNEQVAFAPTGTWTFPAGTVFVKTFQLQTNQSDPNSLLRLETRLLVRDTNGTVYGVTYKWRADNSEADLLTAGSNQDIAITTPSGVVTQRWYYPSPAECLQCHTPVANYVLGVNSRQLNGDNTYSSGVTDNQLRTLNRLGLFYPAIDEASIPGFEHLSNLTNTAASFEQRVRSYIDANCAQCHQPGGAGPTFDARYDTPLTNQNLIYGLLTQGDLGYDNAYVVKPKDVWRSVLYDRVNTTDPDIQMPDFRNLIDTSAVSVLAAWINSLPGTPAAAPPAIVPAGGSFPGSVTITLQPPDTNAILYYTLDGSLPTTNSLLYTSPFVLNSSALVSANAFETGFLNSVAAHAQFTIITNMAFSLPSYPPGGSFQVRFAAAPSNTYVLQASTDLTHWVPVATNTPLSSPFTWTDPGSTNYPARFYRVLQLP